jgi:regulator of sigma E protease
MILSIIIAFVSLIGLIIIHELGHFLLAKKFGMKVEEFGIGYPPRLFGKKIGETIYSINWLPLGGFCRIFGQETKEKDSGSFSSKPYYQKALVILGGVLVFWILAAVLLGIVSTIGSPVVVEDDVVEGIVNPQIQILGIASGSPAEEANLEVGNIIQAVNGIEINKVSQLQNIINENKGNELVLTIKKGSGVNDVVITPRKDVPDGEGPVGISLARTALKSTPWYLAPLEGIKETYYVTITIIKAFAGMISGLVQGQGMPEGVQLGGPIMIFDLFVNVGGLGVSYILRLIAIIAIHLAILNILPIPALDGGWFVFLTIERLTGKDLNDKIIQKVSVFFFLLLVALLIFVTIKDIMRFF